MQSKHIIHSGAEMLLAGEYSITKLQLEKKNKAWTLTVGQRQTPLQTVNHFQTGGMRLRLEVLQRQQNQICFLLTSRPAALLIMPAEEAAA